MRSGSWPISSSDSSCTAARTVSARPSTTGSPQPQTPSSVLTLRNSQRGATRNVSTPVIFTRVPHLRGILGGGPAAVDGQLGPGDERRRAREQKSDHVRPLRRVTEPARRGRLRAAFAVLRRDAVPGL